jgi:hypothetical protein
MQEFLERYSLQDLVALGRSEGVKLSERALHDLPAWGLLPLATTEGRAPGEGVGRYWTREHAIVFSGQLQARATGTTTRGMLVNIPVAAWLLQGESWAPLEQVRRALATWLNWYRHLTPRAIERVTLHTLRHRRDVTLALQQGAMTKADLVAEAKSVPARTDAAAYAAFFGKLRGPLADAARPEEQDRLVANRAADTAAFDAGVDALSAASDELLRETRELYFENLRLSLNRQSTPAAVTRMIGEREVPAACANVFSVLGKLVEARREEGSVKRFIQEGVQASLALSSLFVQIENARLTGEGTTDTSNRVHSHRSAKGRRRSVKRKP